MKISPLSVLELVLNLRLLPLVGSWRCFPVNPHLLLSTSRVSPLRWACHCEDVEGPVVVAVPPSFGVVASPFGSRTNCAAVIPMT